MEGGATGGRVRVVSRRTVRPLTTPPPTTVKVNGCCHPPLKDEEVEVIHLTPLDLRLTRTDYIQKSVLLPNPPLSGEVLADALESSFARTLRRFYPLAGRLATDERGDGTVTVSLRCTGEDAEFVHATAHGVAAADIVSSVYTPPVVLKSSTRSIRLSARMPLCAAIESLPLVSVQVTERELADGRGRIGRRDLESSNLKPVGFYVINR